MIQTLKEEAKNALVARFDSILTMVQLLFESKTRKKRRLAYEIKISVKDFTSVTLEASDDAAKV